MLIWLSYCSDSLCDVRAFLSLTQDAPGQAELNKLRARLTKQYGAPANEDDTTTSEECQDKVMECITSGEAQWKATWMWADGSLILAKTGSDGNGPVVGIRYSAAVADQGSLNAEAF